MYELDTFSPIHDVKLPRRIQTYKQYHVVITFLDFCNFYCHMRHFLMTYYGKFTITA